VLKVDPGNTRARDQRKLIEQLRVIAEAPPAPDKPDTRDDGPRRMVRPDFPLLSVDDINLIKVYETNLADPPRLRVDRQTVEELIAAYAQSDLIPTSKEGRDALLRQSPERILDLMFRLRAREFYPRVKVLDQPESMRAFREQVHGAWLLNACATDRCHGGTDAGRLMLYNRSRNAEAAVYTNFLILERGTLADGTPLINYDQPQRSPLLHLGLPRERSLYPHPESQAARGWKPSFTSQRDRRYEEALDWIRSMYRPRPEYPITYTPPPWHLVDRASTRRAPRQTPGYRRTDATDRGSERHPCSCSNRRRPRSGPLTRNKARRTPRSGTAAPPMTSNRRWPAGANRTRSRRGLC
jgi:hypothetical protein